MENTDYEIIMQPLDKEGIYRHIERCANLSGKYQSMMNGESHIPLVKDIIRKKDRNTLENGTIYIGLSVTIDNFTHRIEHKNISDKKLLYRDLAAAFYTRYENNADSRVNVIFLQKVTVYCITTTYATLLQGEYSSWQEAVEDRFRKNWLEDMTFLINPTVYHRRRYTVRHEDTIYTDFADSEDSIIQEFQERVSSELPLN